MSLGLHGVKAAKLQLIQFIRWRYLVASLASVLLGSMPAAAATVFVDWQNSGVQDGTAAHPYQTLPAALAVAAPGDTIAIRTGPYNLFCRGPLNKPATFRADNGLVTITNDKCLRLHIIPLTDAPDPNGNVTRPFAITPQQFADLIVRVNWSFEGTGIRLVFDPATDWQPMADTQLNTLDTDTPGVRDRGNQIAASNLGKIVCFLRWGDKPVPTGNGNAYPPPGAGPRPPNVPDIVQNYVALPNRIDPPFGLLNQGNGSFVAHEIGHYLGLYHTFPGWTDRRGPVYDRFPGEGVLSMQEADQAVVDYIAANGGTIDALDGDLLSDTPPDPSGVLYAAHNNQNICAQRQIVVSGTRNGVLVSFTFAPDSNVMSYHPTCGPAGAPPPPARFSPQEVERMRHSLQHPSRRHLLPE